MSFLTKSMSNSKGKDKKRPRGSSSSLGKDDSRILEKLTSIQDRIENGFTKINSEMETLRCQMREDIGAMREELKEAIKSLSAAWEEVESLKAKNKHLEDQVEGAPKENCQLKKEVEILKDRAVKQEDYSRRENLRIINVPEEVEEDNTECVKKVKDILSELGVPPDIKFHAVHRTGRPKPASNESSEEGARSATRPQAILVRFVSRMDADMVWTKRKELLKSRRFRTVFIDKVSAESAKERGKLRAAYKKAKELNIERAFIKGKNLTDTQQTLYLSTFYQVRRTIFRNHTCPPNNIY